MIRRIHSTLCLFGILLGSLVFAQTSPAQIRISDEIIFPLPTREERLIQEAQNAQTPVSQLVERLKDPSYKVRLVAVRKLGARGDASVLPALEEVKKDEQTLPIQEQIEAAVSVARARIQTNTQEEAKQIDPLLPFLNSPDAEEQLEAILALGDYQSKAVTEALISYLKTHEVVEWSYIYLRAIMQLVERDKKAALPYIEAYFAVPPVMHRDTGGVGRERITDPDIDQLAQFYWEQQLEGLSAAERVALIVKTLTDQKRSPGGWVDLRNQLVKSGPAISPRLRELARAKGTAYSVKQMSVESLGLLHDVQAAKLLFSIFSDQSEPEDLQEAAFSALVHIRNPRAISILKQRLSDFEPQEKSYKLVNSLWAVLNVATQQTDKSEWEAVILPYVKGGDIAALMVVREIGGARSVDALINLINDSESWDDDRRQTIKSTALGSLVDLAKLEPEKVKQYAKYLLQYDTDPMTRVTAAQILARTGDKSLIPILHERLKSEFNGLAIWYEVSAIYALGGKQAVEALEEIKSFQEQLLNPNKQLLKWVDEALLRLEREKRTGD